MTKDEREYWDDIVEYARAGDLECSVKENTTILAADVYIRKLERELQALKNKKTMAALLMKKV